VRWKPPERERHPLACTDLDRRHRGCVFGDGRRRGAQLDRVRTGGHHERIVETAQRGYDPPIAEAGQQLGANPDSACQTFHDPDDCWCLATGGHGVDHTNPPGRHVPLRLEHERSIAITAGRLPRSLGGHQPAAVLAVTEQGRKARV
jgi:hypothetical protein